MGQANTDRALVRQILERATAYPWTVATGRLTLMLEKDGVCINLFHERFEQPWTRVHTHTMDFRSRIIAGSMRHRRYSRAARPEDLDDATEYGYQRLSLANEPLESGTCFLAELTDERYVAVDEYEIAAPEIHRADAVDGTVTLVTRQFLTNPQDVCAFWPLPLPAANPAFSYGALADAELVKEMAQCALSLF